MNRKRPRLSVRTIAKRKLLNACPCCSTENPWVNNLINIEQEFRGQKHSIKVTVSDCRHCNYTTTTHEQDEELLSSVRKAHAQWLKNEVSKARSILGFSIREFAEQISIGSATISRINVAETLVDSSTEEFLLYKIKSVISKKSLEKLVWLAMDRGNKLTLWSSPIERDSPPLRPEHRAYKDEFVPA